MLPKLKTNTYTTNLITDNKEIEFRPFLVAEQKILLMALETKNDADITQAIRKILSACILTPGIDIEGMLVFDLHKLFLELRKKSVGEIVELKIVHPDSECKGTTDVTINLDDVKVDYPEKVDSKIMLSDDIGVIMKFPSSKIVNRSGTNTITAKFSILAGCIEKVFDKETVYSDFTEKEMEEWLDNLDSNQLLQMMNYLQSMPSLYYDLDYKCSSCSQNIHMRLEGSDFFM